MTRHTFETMGTVASLAGVDRRATAAVAGIFTAADERFSLFRPDSELSRVASGAQTMMDSGAELRDAYAQALSWRSSTGGAFTPNRPDGVVDLNGIVKAQTSWAAGEFLLADGWFDWTLDVGGDILVAGARPDAIGIVNPTDRSALLCAVTLRGNRRAVATSGTAEQGDHIWLTGTTQRSDFVQVTVIADDIIAADVLATAIIAGGRRTLDDLTERWDIDVITVGRRGELSATPGAKTALAV